MTGNVPVAWVSEMALKLHRECGQAGTRVSIWKRQASRGEPSLTSAIAARLPAVARAHSTSRKRFPSRRETAEGDRDEDAFAEERDDGERLPGKGLLAGPSAARP